jgi:LCP family protein required for cell wall assembly
MSSPAAPAPTPVTRPRRAWARFALRLVIALVVTGVGTAAAVVTARDYAVSKFDDTVGTVPIQAGVLTPRGAGSQPAQNLLVVGSDSRAGLEGEGFGDPDEVGGQRSDVIMLVHVDPKEGTATLVSIPRDTWVTLDNGRKGRINESFARGADGVIKTVTANFGIPVNHYLEVDFAGVRDIVNSVGGVTVFLYYPARDRLSGLDVGGGCVHLDGDQGLAYVRARHFESLVDGKWVTDPTGDIGRINRQQDFVRRLAATALGEVGSNPLKANSIGNSVLAALKRDPGFSAQATSIGAALIHDQTNVGQDVVSIVIGAIARALCGPPSRGGNAHYRAECCPGQLQVHLAQLITHHCERHEAEVYADEYRRQFRAKRRRAHCPRQRKHSDDETEHHQPDIDSPPTCSHHTFPKKFRSHSKRENRMNRIIICRCAVTICRKSLTSL